MVASADWNSRAVNAPGPASGDCPAGAAVARVAVTGASSAKMSRVAREARDCFGAGTSSRPAVAGTTIAGDAVSETFSGAFSATTSFVTGFLAREARLAGARFAAALGGVRTAASATASATTPPASGSGTCAPGADSTGSAGSGMTMFTGTPGAAVLRVARRRGALTTGAVSA